jgi:tetratricopeptide (TPR) repeat protein
VELAKEHLIKALRFNQEQAQAYNNLGFIYYKEQKYGKAHDMFQRALKVNPDYTEARYNLGLAFMGLKKKKEARKEFRTIIAINERLADPHHQLGVLALEDGELDEAIDETRRAVELDPGYGDAWMNLGNAYATAGRAQEAKDAFTSCLEVDPNNAQCRHNLALSAQKAALMNPALKDAERSVEFAGGAPERFELARQYGEKGLLAEKERQLRKCVEADGKYTPCHFGLFQIFKEDGRQREARIACKNVLKFASTDEFPNEISQCDKFLSLQP